MPAAPSFAHHLTRTIVIEAPRELVFSFFTDAQRWATWWGPGSTIDPKPGGRMVIRYPDGSEAVGEVVSVNRPESIVFTYGYASGKMIPPGGSRVSVNLVADPRGTVLHFKHEYDDKAVLDMHVQGWRYQLSLFGNAVANLLHANAAATVDEWFGAWLETDQAKRGQRLAAIAASDVRFRDRYSLVNGVDEVNAQIGAAQQFMPGLRMERRGDVRHCQGQVLADWAAIGADGQERGRGTNLYSFGPHGKIESVVGFWA